MKVNPIRLKRLMINRIKQTLIWRIVCYAIRSLLDLIWIITFGAKAYYLHLRYKLQKNERPSLSKTGVELFFGDPEFTQFAHWLKSRIPLELLREERSRLEASDNESDFCSNIINKLDAETKLGILRFALSERSISFARHYLGFVPRLAGIWVQFNIPKGKGPLGSQRWHRDGDIHKGINYFLCVSDVDENTGALSVVGKNWISSHAEIPIMELDTSKTVYDRFRHSDDEIARFVPRNAIQKISGPAGTCGLVDPAWVYHKGGHCSTDHRLLVQISYYSEEQPKHSRMKNILDELGLTGSPALEKIINTPIQHYMVSGFRKPLIDGGFFTTLSKKFTFYLSKSAN